MSYHGTSYCFVLFSDRDVPWFESIRRKVCIPIYSTQYANRNGPRTSFKRREEPGKAKNMTE